MNLVKGLKAIGVRATVICLIDEGQFGRELREAGYEVISIDAAKGSNLRTIWHLAAVLRKLKPDILNVHDLSSLLFTWAANTICGRIPLVMTCHGLLLNEGLKLRLQDRLASRSVKRLIAVSEQAAQEYSSLLRWPGATTVIPNGVVIHDRSSEARAKIRRELDLADGQFIFLAVGNIGPEKSYEDLLQASVELRKSLNRKHSIIVAGLKRQGDYWPMLENLHRRLPQDIDFRFIGYRPNIADLYSAADAFVLCSKKEGCPMVLLEAMGAGLPVVATRVGGIPKIVQPDVNGLLIDPGEPEHLTVAMKRVAEDSDLRQHLSEQACRTIRQGFTSQAMAEKYLDVYRDMCK